MKKLKEFFLYRPLEHLNAVKFSMIELLLLIAIVLLIVLRK